MRILSASILCIAFVVTGCATSPTSPIPTGPGVLSPLVDSGVIAPETRAKAQQVQAQIKSGCGLVLQFGSLVSAVGGSFGMTANAIANGLCLAATTTPLADGGRRVVYYNGVRLKGTVRGKKLS